ncbi:MAG: PDZ domain-containing protein [Planctomycetes bacterium]|nr:PDZ domain-containing protein [Planctomycetota bacterium]
MRLAPRLFLLLVLASPGVADEAELEKARSKVRELESEIEALIDRVGPAVGAVMNYTTAFDEATGRVAMNPRSLGSGCLVTADGFFLTNVHVVEGAGYLTVALPDGERYPAVLHADTSEGAVKGDIALLRLRGKGRFPYVDWKRGNAGRLAPGSFVFAMGNPHGHALDGTPVVTMGILSGSGRAAAETGYLYVDAVQTDAEINPGNSGGPLFDSKGNFIGINGLMNSRQGRSNSGIGFAIPVEQVRLFMDQLLRMKEEGGGIGYGFHGIEVASTADEEGARVERVARGSPADEAGMRRDDIIVNVNGTRVANRTEFVNLVGKLPEKSLLKVLFKRSGKLKRETFRLVSYEAYREAMGIAREAGPLPPPRARLPGRPLEGGACRGDADGTHPRHRRREGGPARGRSAQGDRRPRRADSQGTRGDPRPAPERNLREAPLGARGALPHRQAGLCDAATAAGLGE